MDFPINQELLEATSKLKEERRLLQDRLKKIDDRKSEVSDSVYQRVRSDYEKKQSSLSDSLLAKKSEVDRELVKLYETRKKVEINVKTHGEQLEELRFRHSLGEFEESSFEEKAGDVSEKLTKFETLLAAINNNIERYEKIFADEPEFTQSQSQSKTTSTAKVKSDPIAELIAENDSIEEVEEEIENTPTPANSSNTYNLDESQGDYFAPHKPSNALTDTQVFKLPEDEGETMIGPAPLPPEAAANLNVVEGPNIGSLYQLTAENILGRGSNSNIVLKDAKVSRAHAAIRYNNHSWNIEDMGSSNGIFVNGARTKNTELNPGDHIQIGDFIFEFRMSAENS